MMPYVAFLELDFIESLLIKDELRDGFTEALVLMSRVLRISI